MEELRLLVVDDENRAADRIVRALKKIGFPAHAVLLCPEEDRLGEPLLGLTGLTTRDLGEFDLALVDLELEALHRRQRESIRYHPDDLRGGSEILPHIRREAPWLPVVGYSKLFEFEIQSFLAVVGSFGFDGLIQRTMFDESWLTHELWELVVSRAEESRRRAVLGAAFAEERAASVLVRYPDGLAAHLSSLGASWEEVIQQMFYFASTVSLEPLSAGFSGASVVRATVTSRLEVGTQTGTWVAKIGKSRAKLWEECRAHSRLARAGLPLARSVPLLWDGIITRGNLAGIAYQLAGEADDALQVLLRDGPDVVLAKVRPLLHEFHASATRDHYPLGKLLIGAVASPHRVDAAVAQLPNWDLGLEWKRAREGLPSPVLDRTVFITAGLIHGDLHLRNILLGKRDVLIDFALTKPGPIVYDLAKLTSDVLLAHPESLQKVYTATHQDPFLASLLLSLNGGDWKTQQDETVFDAALQICFAQALSYDGVTAENREILAKMLVRSRLSEDRNT